MGETESKRRQDNAKVCRRITKELREQPGRPSTDSPFQQTVKSVAQTKGAKKLPVTIKVECSCCKRMVDESFCENVRCPPSYICTAANEDLFLGLYTESEKKRRQDNKVCRSCYEDLFSGRITKELREQPKPCVRCDRVVERALLDPCYAVKHGMPLYRCTQGKSPGWFSGWSKEKKATEKRKRKNYNQCVANTKQL